MKKVFFICLFSFYSSFGATSHHYHYERPLAPGDYAFRRFITPQLKQIIREFYQLLQKLNPIQRELLAMREKIEQLVSAKEEERIDQLYWQLDHLILSLESQKITFTKKMSSEEIDNYLLCLGNLEKIARIGHQLLYDRKMPLANPICFFGGDNIILLSIGEERRSLFDFIWVGFFSPIKKFIIEKEDKAYLMNNLEELNTAWNSFNMKLAKGQKQYPKSIGPIISMIHSRWNSVLKVILRP